MSASERTEMKCVSSKKHATEPDSFSISKPGGFKLFAWLVVGHHHYHHPHHHHVSGPKDERLHSLFASHCNFTFGKHQNQVVG